MEIDELSNREIARAIEVHESRLRITTTCKKTGDHIQFREGTLLERAGRGRFGM